MTEELPDFEQFLQTREQALDWMFCPTEGKGTAWKIFQCDDEITVLRFWCSKGMIVAPHVHHERICVTVYNGRCEFTIEIPGDKRVTILGVGDSMVLPENVPHAFEALDETSLVATYVPAIRR